MQHFFFKVKNTSLSSQTVLAAKSRNSFYSTRLCFKPNSAEGKEHVTDKSGNHTSSWQGFCNEPECPAKICTSPCGDILYMENQGHYTHKVPKDKDGIFIDQTDFHNNITPKGQSFVRSHPNGRPTLQKEDMKALTENDLKLNKAADSYSLANDLYEKI